MFFGTSNLFSNRYNYLAHLLIFLFILVNSQCNSKLSLKVHKQGDSVETFDHFSLSFIQYYIPLMYFQAGISKLIESGLSWTFTGMQ